jgi:hypothetical protein
MKNRNISIVTEHTINDESTSMNWWSNRLLNKGGRATRFAHEILKEDKDKPARLASLSASIGLPLYETHSFEHPRDADRVTSLCRRLATAGWKINFRMLDSSEGHLLFRHVDVNVKMVATMLARLRQQQCTVIVSPYKAPTISGTVLVDSGNTWLEMVYGPHYWLSKISPTGVDVLRCWYHFPHLSVQYSTDDQKQRDVLFHNLSEVVHITLGITLRQLSETQRSLYAEYHWRNDIGYRFLDCSYL